MSHRARQIADKRGLKLIRACRPAGIRANGRVTTPLAGPPQGAPLAPVLANIVWDEWDKELETRGLRFCRYGDDCTRYGRSGRAGARVRASRRRFRPPRLKLKVNGQKSAGERPQPRRFLGLSLTGGKSPPRRKSAPQALTRGKARGKALTRRSPGRSLGQVLPTLSVYRRGGAFRGRVLSQL